MRSFVSTTLCNCSLLALLVLAGGCYSSYNLATRREEVSFTSTEREIRMGQAIAKRVLKHFKPVDNEAMQERVRLMGERSFRIKAQILFPP